MARVFVGVGSNVSPERHIQAALSELVASFGPVDASPAYRSCAVGFDGDDFINLVVAFESELPPLELNRRLHEIERECGRERGSKRFAPRVIDLDLLLVGDEVNAGGQNTGGQNTGGQGPELPRDEILHYAFVLRPLAELAPEMQHPVENCRLDELWSRHRARIDQGDLQAIQLAWPEGVKGH